MHDDAPHRVTAPQICEDPPSALAEYARVPIAFTVRERLDVEPLAGGLGGFALHRVPVAAPWVKDYDAVAEDRPTAWAARFDVARWGILSAWVDGARVGGIVVAWNTPSVAMLEGRADLAVIWDLRVAPAWRGRGVGGALLRAADAWALARGAHWLKVETQSINVDACRLYARHGCTLGAVHRFAYPTLPDEAQLLWYKPLGVAATRAGVTRRARVHVRERGDAARARRPSRLAANWAELHRQEDEADASSPVGSILGSLGLRLLVLPTIGALWHLTLGEMPHDLEWTALGVVTAGLLAWHAGAWAPEVAAWWARRRGAWRGSS